MLLPEGALRLNPTALQIVKYCDGSRSYAKILEALREVFLGAEFQQIDAEAGAFLEQLQARGAVRF